MLLMAAERAEKAVAVAEPQQWPWFAGIVLVCELHIMGWVFTYRSFVKCVGHAAVELQLLVRGSIGGICLRIQLFGKLASGSSADADAASFELVETIRVFCRAELHRACIYIALRKQIPQF